MKEEAEAPSTLRFAPVDKIAAPDGLEANKTEAQATAIKCVFRFRRIDESPPFLSKLLTLQDFQYLSIQRESQASCMQTLSLDPPRRSRERRGKTNDACLFR